MKLIDGMYYRIQMFENSWQIALWNEPMRMFYLAHNQQVDKDFPITIDHEYPINPKPEVRDE